MPTGYVHSIRPEVAHQFAAMRLQSIPNNQHRLLELRLECLEKLDDLFLLDATFVETKQASLENF